jgi:broad specificity phosphatase PhoE
VEVIMASASTEFYLIQHGEKVVGPGDPPITRRGRCQAHRTAHALRHCGIRHLFSSPHRRARQTAQPLADVLCLPIAIDARLRERMDWGDGPSTQTLDEFLTDWEHASRDRDFIPRSGDSSHQTGRRMLALLEEIATNNPGEAAALVTHGGATVDLIRDLVGDAYVTACAGDLIRNGPASCAITHLSRGDNGYILRALASVAHLCGNAND